MIALLSILEALLTPSQNQKAKILIDRHYFTSLYIMDAESFVDSSNSFLLSFKFEDIALQLNQP